MMKYHTFKLLGQKWSFPSDDTEMFTVLIPAERKRFRKTAALTISAALLLSAAAIAFGATVVPYEAEKTLPRDFGVQYPEALTVDDGFGEFTATLVSAPDRYPGGFSGLPLHDLDRDNHVAAEQSFYAPFGEKLSSPKHTHARVKFQSGEPAGWGMTNLYQANDPVAMYQFDAPMKEGTLNFVGDAAALVRGIETGKNPTKLKVAFDIAAMQKAGLTELLPLDRYYYPDSNTQRYLWLGGSILFTVIVLVAAGMFLYSRCIRTAGRLREAGALRAGPHSVVTFRA